MYLDKFDIAVLKMLNGDDQDVISGWGAVMSLVIEKLKNLGLVTRIYSDSSVKYVITEEGKQALKGTLG